jgi:two-component system, chemotaxis family, chemotaxis protein CheY
MIPGMLPDNEMMPRTVLIVEDTEACAATLEIAFSGVRDIEVVTVIGAEDAWRMVDDAGELAAIVTDLQMGGMDGFELIERVRAHERHRAVPIVVITGSSDPDAPERVHRLGANAFFAKPYSPVQVREKLEQLLQEVGSKP